ncbi:hypothetical protein GCM10023322_08080 [Rugosimonospora acidiphila]|uniref:Transcription regulator AsnC/Lrp ligand binding domain-containing protein n=1 Tax=Rugosimonospora acidiphila TaxID=556531 RepID=A0ABP9RLE8_9ACTN
MLSVFVVAGGDEFLVHVAIPDVDGLHAFLMDKFSGCREILGFRCSVIYGVSGSGSSPRRRSWKSAIPLRKSRRSGLRPAGSSR